MFKISFSRQADKTLRKMPRNMALIISKKIKKLAVDPHAHGMRNVKKLTNHPGYRLRVGDWRVVYTVHDSELIIHVVKIKTRGEVYK